MLDAAASVKSPRRVCISECIAVCTNFGAGSLRIIFRSRAEGAWQGSRRKAPERGGVRLPRQAEAGGTSHRHPVSGPRGCRALPPHFPRCSLGAFRRIGAAMAKVRRQVLERGGVRLPRQANAGGTSHRHPVSCPRGCRALPPHFPRCSLGAFQCGLMLASQVCRSCGCPRVAAGPHSISKDCAACPLHLLTAGRRQLVTYIGSGALTQ
jgi:hypothetical protein